MTDQMKRFGLIGHPIEHSLSPALFKAGYAGRYPYELIQTADFEEAYRRFLEGYDGINVTAPFKELALDKADIISEECRLTGAANILIKTRQGITAYNSDFRGLRRLLSGKGSLSQRTHVLIVGWGGASKAAKAAAESLGFETLVINRTRYSSDIRPLSEFKEHFLKADIVIYNLPVKIEEIDKLTKEELSGCRRKVILEANYRNPSFEKALIENWRRLNPEIEFIDGRAWLLAQAITGYEIFTGELPDCDAMSRELI